jgi:hypothetical protein
MSARLAARAHGVSAVSLPTPAAIGSCRRPVSVSCSDDAGVRQPADARSYTPPARPRALLTDRYRLVSVDVLHAWRPSRRGASNFNSETGKTFMINTCSKKDLSILSYDFLKTNLKGLS